jgi:ribA/ribD-fused uncharacterized protein
MNKRLFYRVSDPYGAFSNFSKHQIFVDGTTWATSEQYFQAQKFLNFKDRMDVQLAESPMVAANIGRDRNRQIRKDWEALKDGFMRKACFAKVIQHAEVRELLLSTSGAILIEHTENDFYWADGGDGTGKNMLGLILMEIREKVIYMLQSGNYEMLPPWEVHKDIERHSIGWRMGRGEGYLMEWGPWFSGLSSKEKESYKKKFPAPEKWGDYYD